MSVSLQKNQGVSLSKEAGGGLKKISLGVGWDVAAPKKGIFSSLLGGGGGGGSIDLDASCIAYDAGASSVDVVWFGQLTSRDGSIRHSGDNLTGEGDGDDETIVIDLERLPAQVETIILTVNSFRGQTFDKVANAYARVIDNNNGRELARFNISDSGPHTGLLLASLKRAGNQWNFTALGERTSGRTVHDLASAATAHAR